jgi:predicted dehydrogenase
MTQWDTTRRGFLAAATAGLAGCAMPQLGSAKNIRKGQLVTGRKINIAHVGCGGKGADDVRQFSGENTVALCDVDAGAVSAAFAEHPNARVFRDWREMLAVMDDQIDAVVVSTPDHTHFPAAMMAMEMGKHVYVQKPMAHTVTEARLMAEAARLHSVKTQMGNQGHSNEGTRLVKEWIEAGLIGEVREVVIWTNRPVWPQNLPLPDKAVTPPATLDWNRWLGVAPWRPYNPVYMPFQWRGWWEYGTGALGDMGCHTMDASFWALNLGAPTSVSAEVEGGSAYSCPAGTKLVYQFPARGSLPPVKLTWYDGTRKPPRPAQLEADRAMPASGQLYLGSKGTIMDGNDYCDSPRLIPESAMASMKRPPKTLPRVPHGHYQNWLDAIRGKIDQSVSCFDYAGPLTEMVLLGSVAVRCRGSFNWDAKSFRCDNPAAQAFLDKTYRSF